MPKPHSGRCVACVFIGAPIRLGHGFCVLDDVEDEQVSDIKDWQISANDDNIALLIDRRGTAMFSQAGHEVALERAGGVAALQTEPASMVFPHVGYMAVVAPRSRLGAVCARRGSRRSRPTSAKISQCMIFRCKALRHTTGSAHATSICCSRARARPSRLSCGSNDWCGLAPC
jgi:hypothetical protein